MDGQDRDARRRTRLAVLDCAFRRLRNACAIRSKLAGPGELITVRGKDRETARGEHRQRADNEHPAATHAEQPRAKDVTSFGAVSPPRAECVERRQKEKAREPPASRCA